MRRSVVGTTCLVTLFTLALAKADITSGLVAYYPFNGNANDESGNSRHLTVLGPVLCPDRIQSPISAYRFDGIDDYMMRAETLVSANTFTWSLWFRANSNPSGVERFLIHEGDAYTGGSSGKYSPCLILVTAFTNQIRFWTYTSSIYPLDSPNLSNDTNMWHNVAVTSSSNGNRRLYVDGVIQATALNAPFGQICPNFYVGANGYRHTAYFSGSIDNIRIYARELSTNDLDELYAFESQPSGDMVKSIHYIAHGLTAGNSYKVQQSLDVTNWVDSGISFTATNSTWLCPTPWFVDQWDQLYLRVQGQ